MEGKMKFLCKVLGHAWKYFGMPDDGTEGRCSRCGHSMVVR
jgi:hypothetical protein